MAGEVEGRGIVDRQAPAPRLPGSARAAQSIMPLRKSPLIRPCQRSSTTSVRVLRRWICPRLPARPLGVTGNCGRRSNASIRASEKPSMAAAIWCIEVFGDQPRVAAEQGQRDDRHRRPRRLGRHVAPFAVGPARHRRARRLDERPALRLDRGRREAGGDDPPLLAPQFAVGGQQAPADDRVEQGLDDVGLGVIGGIVEQDMLHMIRVEHDMDLEAEDVALEMIGLEGELRPAVDRSPRPLAEEAAPAGDRLGLPRRIWRDEAGAHSAANSVSAPPRSTETSRLTPFSIMVTP